MAEPIISFIPENDKQFQRGIDRLGKTVSDFRIPFGLISNDWYRSNKIIFGLKSAGLYPDFGGFSPDEKDQKIKGRTVSRRVAAQFRKKQEVGFVFPLLKRHGALQRSLESRSAPDAEFFIGRQFLIMGTNVPYAKFHQSDKKPRLKLPQRKVVFISGGKNEASRDSRITGRLQRWLNIMNDHVTQVLTGEI